MTDLNPGVQHQPLVHDVLGHGVAAMAVEHSYGHEYHIVVARGTK